MPSFGKEGGPAGSGDYQRIILLMLQIELISLTNYKMIFWGRCAAAHHTKRNKDASSAGLYLQDSAQYGKS